MGLDDLVRQMQDDTTDIWRGLQAGALSVDRWQETQARSVLTFHMAAYMMGRGYTKADQMTPREVDRVTERVKEQIEYLNGFADTIDAEWNGGELKAGWLARAKSYAGAIKAQYWRGATLGIVLPAYPGDGSSECIGNCGCAWDLQWLDEENGDADARWVRGKDDSCPTCLRRGVEWAPLRIRNGQAARAYRAGSLEIIAYTDVDEQAVRYEMHEAA